MKHKTIQQLRGMEEQIQGGNEMNKELKAYNVVASSETENNILKRALWLTRALRARDIQRWWLQVTCSPRTEIACRKWNNVERKCRAKAEEYK